MVLTLFASALLLTMHAVLTVGLGLLSDRGIDWATGVFGALFFALAAGLIGREASYSPVASRSALAMTGATEVRGRLTPFIVLTAACAVLLTGVSTILLGSLALAPIFSVSLNEAMSALVLSGFVLLFNAVIAGYAVGCLRSRRIALIALAPDGVSVATSGSAPTFIPWAEIDSVGRTCESTNFPIGLGDFCHHHVWRFGELSVRTPADLRPTVGDVDREIKRLAPHVRVG